jgi:DNA-binding SARP family transcriptional activator/Tfp pilus assembly protein PilF
MRTFALLCFLVLESGRPHSRTKLAELLWEDLPAASSRQSLRQALYSLRTVAGGRLNDCLHIDSGWVQLSQPVRDASIDIDVHRFLAAAHSTDEKQWREAAATYNAPLLEGRSFGSCTAYEAWLSTARERLHALAMQNLDRLIVGHMTRGEWESAIGFAEAMRERDPTSEAASQYLMRIFAERGEPQAIDAEWSRLCRLLMQELGIEPTTGTSELYRALCQRRARSIGSAATVTTRVGGIRLAAAEAESIVRAGRAAERVYAFSQAADLYDRALEVMRRAGHASPQRHVDVLLLREAALERLGRRADQELTINEALSIAKEGADVSAVAVVLLRLASVCAYLNRHEEARNAAEDALRIYQDMGDPPGEAEALRELGFVHWHAGDYSAALRHSREALALHRRMGDITGEATALHNLAEIHRGLGSPLQATQWFEQALRLHWAAHNHGGEILSLFGWAHALRQAGDLQASKQKYEEAMKLSEQNGERALHSRAMHALAIQHATQGELDTAIVFMRRAIEVDRAIGYAHALGHDLVDLSNIHLFRGEVVEARVSLQEALVWFGFTEDADALTSTHARLIELDANSCTQPSQSTLRLGVKSHLPLSEGKVYCEFESPVRHQARR